MDIVLGIILTSCILWLIVCSQFLEELTWKTAFTLFIACIVLSMTGRFFGILRISAKVTSLTYLKETPANNVDEPIENQLNTPDEIASAEALPFVTISTATPNHGVSTGTFSPVSSSGEIPPLGSYSLPQGIASK